MTLAKYNTCTELHFYPGNKIAGYLNVIGIQAKQCLIQDIEQIGPKAIPKAEVCLKIYPSYSSV